MVHFVAIFLICVLSGCLVGQAQSDAAELATNAHNKYRRLQGSSDMKMMKWDEGIAQQAAEYASKCVFAHDPKRGQVGENIYVTSAVGVQNIDNKGITAWYNEIFNYDVSSFKCAAGKVCGHYTQVVWANSYRLGCAAASCPSGIKGAFSQGTIYICRYGPPGNYVGQNPFKVGAECSKCDESDDEWGNCLDGLCATDDMIPDTTTVTTRSTTNPTSTTTSTTAQPSTSSTSTNKPGSTTTSQPQATSSTSTIYSSTTPGTEPTEEPHCPTESPNDPDRGCSCSRYEEVLDDYEEKLRDWEEKYNAWKEKYNKCG